MSSSLIESRVAYTSQFVSTQFGRRVTTSQTVIALPSAAKGHSGRAQSRFSSRLLFPGLATTQMNHTGLRRMGNSVTTLRLPHTDQLRLPPRNQELPQRTVYLASPDRKICEPEDSRTGSRRQSDLRRRITTSKPRRPALVSATVDGSGTTAKLLTCQVSPGCHPWICNWNWL